MTDALIFGARGQDGRLLSEYLESRGISVLGASRTAGALTIGLKQYKCIKIDYTNHIDLIQILKKYKPKYIFNFAGNSSVGYSFRNPFESQNSFLMPLHSILEALRHSEIEARLFVANSGEVFGNTATAKIGDAFSPKSPYAAARSYGADLCSMYRDLYELQITTGFLFPHESLYRDQSFFLPKLVSELKSIRTGKKRIANFGNLNVIRDFSWAPDFMDGFFKAMTTKKVGDFIFASGVGVSLLGITNYLLKELDLDPSCVQSDHPKFIRNRDLKISVGNPSDTFHKLDWAPSVGWQDIVQRYLNES